MVEFAEEALRFASERAREDLENDVLLLRALERSIELIGEAANKVSQQYREKTPQIPWREIVGMRNVLIHMYEDVNLDRLWATVIVDLPPLVKALGALVDDFKNP